MSAILSTRSRTSASPVSPTAAAYKFRELSGQVRASMGVMTGIEVHDGHRIASSLERPDEFAVIFERHFDAIHRYIARRLGPGLADDLAATVFAEAFAGRAGFLAHVDDARPWLYGIATNLIRRHRRRERAGWRAYAKHGSDPFGIDAQPRLDE